MPWSVAQPQQTVLRSTDFARWPGAAGLRPCPTLQLTSFVVTGLGYAGYRIMTRGQRVAGQGQQALAAITGND